MENLIKALQIFLNYANLDHPTHCEHDELMIMAITEEEVTEEDKKTLEFLGFHWNGDCWASYRYGSA
jgi:hypothetical protein